MPVEATSAQQSPPVPQIPEGPAQPVGVVGVPPALRPLEREIRTYLRELPRLVDEGNAGRVALVRGDEVLSIWDTFADAYQAGRMQFGMEVFLAHAIDICDVERFQALAT